MALKILRKLNDHSRFYGRLEISCVRWKFLRTCEDAAKINPSFLESGGILEIFGGDIENFLVGYECRNTRGRSAGRAL